MTRRERAKAVMAISSGVVVAHILISAFLHVETPLLSVAIFLAALGFIESAKS